MSDIRKRYILKLRGVFLDNCETISSYNNLDDIEKGILEYNITRYDKIPDIYTKDTWPSNTNLKCWYCDLNFGGIPYFLPQSMEIKNDKVHMGVYGNFCSPFCVVASANERKLMTWEKQKILQLLHQELTGKTIEIPIPPSSNKYKLNYYGGNMNVGEYRKEIETLYKHNYEIWTLTDLSFL